MHWNKRENKQACVKCRCRIPIPCSFSKLNSFVLIWTSYGAFPNVWHTDYECCTVFHRYHKWIWTSQYVRTNGTANLEHSEMAWDSIHTHSLGLHVCACVHHSAISCRILFCTDHSNARIFQCDIDCASAKVLLMWILFHILDSVDHLNRFAHVVFFHPSKQAVETCITRYFICCIKHLTKLLLT